MTPLFSRLATTLAGGAAGKADAASQRLQRNARFLGENSQNLAIFLIQFPHGPFFRAGAHPEKCETVFGMRVKQTDRARI